jgi:hypothetical protein
MMADVAFEPLKPDQMACITQFVPRYERSGEPALAVAAAVAQECFFQQKDYGGYRICYVVAGCEPKNLGYAHEGMERLRLQALLEIIRIRSRPER